jgi:AcrR family transcriptional regulator
MATVRLRRSEQVERNGRLVLEAARRVFLKKGYAGASLEVIADEAGFSKGVVYSQFKCKADLFFALLDERITERARQNEKLLGDLAGLRGIEAMIELAAQLSRAEPAWSLLVIEFRVQAARDPVLNERYRAAHERTAAHLAETLASFHQRAGIEPAFSERAMAELVLAIGVGIQLEHSNNPAALADVDMPQVISAMLAFDPSRVAKKKRNAS